MSPPRTWCPLRPRSLRGAEPPERRLTAKLLPPTSKISQSSSLNGLFLRSDFIFSDLHRILRIGRGALIRTGAAAPYALQQMFELVPKFCRYSSFEVKVGYSE